MAARSVAELLPTAFEHLTSDHVTEIVERARREEGESLFLELKQEPRRDAIAKGCAAFANTYGGLLLVGVDKNWKLRGIAEVGEPQVWVKDVLRGQLLPMPAFRARWIPLADGATVGILAVLIEESSTTPHLVTRTGTIYVRNPGSSDPAPIGDQALLIELTRRGREARATAETGAHHAVEQRWHPQVLFTLGLAATGASRDAVQTLYDAGASAAADTLRTATELYPAAEPNVTHIGPTWSLRQVRLQRQIRRGFPHEPEAFFDSVVMDSPCVVQIGRGLLERADGSAPEPRGPRPLSLDEGVSSDLPLCVLPWVSEALRRGRELVLALGGHGDLRVAFDARLQGRYVFYAATQAEQAEDDFRTAFWLPLEPDAMRDQALERELRQEVLRHLGLEPGSA